jgi:hypothetical protein
MSPIRQHTDPQIRDEDVSGLLPEGMTRVRTAALPGYAFRDLIRPAAEGIVSTVGGEPL